MAGSFRLARLLQLDGVRPPKIAPSQAAEGFVVDLVGLVGLVLRGCGCG